MAKNIFRNSASNETMKNYRTELNVPFQYPGCVLLYSQPILDGSGVRHRGRPLHAKCLVCVECKREVAKFPFAMKDDKAVCITCFVQKHSERSEMLPAARSLNNHAKEKKRLMCACMMPISIYGLDATD